MNTIEELNKQWMPEVEWFINGKDSEFYRVGNRHYWLDNGVCYIVPDPEKAKKAIKVDEHYPRLVSIMRELAKTDFIYVDTLENY